jgi:hypothetical protein
LLPAPTFSAPITFNTALPVAQGEFLFRQQLRWLRSSDDSTALDRKARATAAISVLAYGVNSKLAVFGVLPYLDKELEVNNGGQDVTRSSRGIGDVSAFARYNFYQNNAKGSSLRVSAVGGFAAPTGDDTQSDNLGRLPPPLQSGSGAWNVFGGMVATYQTLGYQFDGQLSYLNNRQANGFEAGDETRLDLSWQHRVWPRALDGGVPGFFYAVLELNALHQDKSRIDGQSSPDSGGDTLWLSPGVQYVTRRWVLEAVVQKPISQNLHGNALENDWIVTSSFRMNF